MTEVLAGAMLATLYVTAAILANVIGWGIAWAVVKIGWRLWRQRHGIPQKGQLWQLDKSGSRKHVVEILKVENGMVHYRLVGPVCASTWVETVDYFCNIYHKWQE